MHYAASRGASEVLQVLVEHIKRGGGVQTDDEDGDDGGSNPLDIADSLMGWTPLMVASAELHVSCVRVLLDAGADPTIVDDVGDAAIDFAPKGKGGRRGREIRSLIKGKLVDASSEEDDEGSASDYDTSSDEEEGKEEEEGKDGSESERFEGGSSDDDSRRRGRR